MLLESRQFSSCRTSLQVFSDGAVDAMMNVGVIDWYAERGNELKKISDANVRPDNCRDLTQGNERV